MSQEFLSQKERVQQIRENSRYYAQHVEKNNRSIVITAANVKNYSLKDNHHTFCKKSERLMRPSEFCAYQKRKNQQSDIFNLDKNKISNPPFYALARMI